VSPRPILTLQRSWFSTILVGFSLLLSSIPLASLALGQAPLTIPPVESGRPAAGKRVTVTAEEYQGTDVHHTLYLPRGWSSQQVESGTSWPVIIEYTGNHYADSNSTGLSEDAALGYGISGGQFIWAVLPCVSEDHQRNEVMWWGDRMATVDYARVNVPRICEEFGGDPAQVFLCGFSRGAIGVNLIGLHDDEMAELWCGLISHDNYDGIREWKGTDWGSPLRFYRHSALRRMKRLKGRPALVMFNGNTAAVRRFVGHCVPVEEFSFLEVDVERILERSPRLNGIHPHTDRWLLEDSPERRAVWKWVAQVRKQATGTNAVPSPSGQR
jgi:hypothetical protein